MKQLPQGISAPAPGLYSIHVYDHPFSKLFFFKTAWPTKAKLHVEPPLEEGKKIYINGLGHTIKIAAAPIYGKNLQKSSPEPEVL